MTVRPISFLMASCANDTSFGLGISSGPVDQAEAAAAAKLRRKVRALRSSMGHVVPKTATKNATSRETRYPTLRVQGKTRDVRTNDHLLRQR